MSKTRLSNDFLHLQRKQLDAKFDQLRSLLAFRAPRGGWIKAIRTSLGMTSAQLGKRLDMTSQGALDLERREVNESISLKKLREAAEALNCQLVVAIVPHDSLESTIQARARTKATEERDKVVHTMRLENQHGGVEDVLDVDKGQQLWLTGRLSDLWD